MLNKTESNHQASLVVPHLPIRPRLNAMEVFMAAVLNSQDTQIHQRVADQLLTMSLASFQGDLYNEQNAPCSTTTDGVTLHFTFWGHTNERGGHDIKIDVDEKIEIPTDPRKDGGTVSYLEQKIKYIGDLMKALDNSKTNPPWNPKTITQTVDGITMTYTISHFAYDENQANALKSSLSSELSSLQSEYHAAFASASAMQTQADNLVQGSSTVVKDDDNSLSQMTKETQILTAALSFLTNVLARKI